MKIGVDIGASHVSAGLVSNGRVVSYKTILIADKQGLVDVISAAVEAVRKDKAVSGIGIGMPGPSDYKHGILTAANLGIKNLSLKKQLEKRFHVPVMFENDASCAVLGEALYGSARKYSKLIGLTLGSGVGGGIIIDKKIYPGRGNAGELGHVIIDYSGPRCSCGRRGCLEAYCGRAGIMRLAKNLPAKNPEELYHLAMKGDKKARHVFSAYGAYLGLGISSLISAFDPEAVVLCGNISRSFRLFSKSMHAAIKETCLLKEPRILESKLKEKAGVLGAASILE